mgnify:FL=1
MEQRERVLIVSVQTTQTDEDFAYANQELAQLVDTAMGEVVATVTQKRESISGRTLVGKGKVEEISHLVDELEVDLVVFYQSLTGSMVKNLNESISCRIIDRVQLILDIFAMRARSKEGKLQVQLAQLNYLLPRLSGQREGLSRQGGGIGTRGPGETRLETDRRYIRKQIQDIEEQLEQIKKHRERSREKRKSSNGFQLGLIGYTNAGKSTILNQLTHAGTYQMDQLFATLDPLTRQVDLFPNFEVTLTDTVGFIQELPPTLIHAFESTLEESADVDLLVHVVDASNAQFSLHEKTVIDLVNDLEMQEIPMVTVYNKTDLIEGEFQPNLYPSIQISAVNEADVERLKAFLKEQVKAQMTYYEEWLDVTQTKELNQLQQRTLVESLNYDEEKNQYCIKGYRK